MFYRVNLFALQLFDRPTSRRQIHAELVVDGMLVCDRLGHIEQQPRGSSELQFEFLICLVSSKCGHGCNCSPLNSETSATLLAILSTLSIFRRSPNYATRIFSQRKIGGTCFYVGAETLSLEYPFPNTPKSGAMMHAASAASGAAGDADSEKSNKLVSEKVNKSCTRKLLKKLCCAKSKV